MAAKRTDRTKEMARNETANAMFSVRQWKAFLKRIASANPNVETQNANLQEQDIPHEPSEKQNQKGNERTSCRLPTYGKQIAATASGIAGSRQQSCRETDFHGTTVVATNERVLLHDR